MATPTFVNDLYNWTDNSIEANWVPDKLAVPAMQPLHRSWSEYNNHINLPPPAWAPPPPPPNSPASIPPPSPRQNVNNQNWDDRVVGEVPLAKKICNGGNFAPLIQVMKDNGHPVPRNAAGKDHCLLWHLRRKCKADCVQKADHVLSSAPLEPLFQWCEQAHE